MLPRTYVGFSAASLSVSKAGSHSTTKGAFNQWLCCIPMYDQYLYKKIQNMFKDKHTVNVFCVEVREYQILFMAKSKP